MEISATYATILLDPPWLESGGGKCKRGADRHYPLLKTKAILPTVLRCPYWTKIADNSHLYMWTTNNFLAKALWLMDALDYRYVTNVCWVKEGKIGLGQYFRGRHELDALRHQRPQTDRAAHRAKGSPFCDQCSPWNPQY